MFLLSHLTPTAEVVTFGLVPPCLLFTDQCLQVPPSVCCDHVFAMH